MKDYLEMVNSVKGELAEAKVFRPEILGPIDKVYALTHSATLISDKFGHGNYVVLRENSKGRSLPLRR